jgi:putative transposase
VPDYRRNRVQVERLSLQWTCLTCRSNLLVARIDALRDAVRQVRARAPFHIDASVVLPDHMHCLRTLPEGDANFPVGGGRSRSCLQNRCPSVSPRSPVITSRGECGIGQRPYREHTIRDDRDFRGSHGLHAFQPSQARVLWRARRICRIRRFIGTLTSRLYAAGWRGGSDEPQQTGERL